MKDISYIRNDLFEYFLDAANNILPRWYENKFELDYIKQEKLAHVLLVHGRFSFISQSVIIHIGTAEPQKFEKKVHEKFLAIRENKVNDLCSWYLSWFHDYIKQTGRYKKDGSCAYR